MKKIGIILSFVLMMVGFQAKAQMYIGGKIGYAGSQTDAANSIENVLPDIRMLHGVTGGVIVGYGFGDHFDLQGELNITQKGFGIDESTGFDLFNIPIDVGVDYRNRFTYLELPILAKGKIGNDKVKGYLAIGPQIGYLAKGRSKAIVNAILPIEVFDRILRLDNLGFNRFEFSGVAAVGVEFNVGIGNFFIEGRYAHGFTDYYEIPLGGGVQIASKIQNRVVTGTVGMTFPIGTARGSSRGGRF